MAPVFFPMISSNGSFVSRCGSILVEYDLHFDTVDPPSSNQLAQTLQNTLDAQGFINGTSFQLDANSIKVEGIVTESLTFLPDTFDCNKKVFLRDHTRRTARDVTCSGGVDNPRGDG